MEALRQHPHVSQAVQQAHQRALADAAPVILRVHVNVPGPVTWWDVWHHCQQHPIDISLNKTPLFVWHDGRRKRWVLGLGACQQQTFNGAQRLHQAQALTFAWQDRFLEMHLQADSWPEQAPLWCAGFAFADDSPNSLEWHNFAGGQLFVPQLCLYELAETAHACTRAIVHVMIAAHEPSDDVYQHLANCLETLHKLSHASATDVACWPQGDVVWQHRESSTSWHTRVHEACAAIQHGLFNKVVLTRSAMGTIAASGQFCPLRTLQALRVQHPASICFAWQQDTDQCFVGATPELLVQVTGTEVYTQALAGTAPRGQTAQQDTQLGAALLEHPKNLHEHRLVVEALRYDLAKRCATLQVDDHPHLIRLPQVQHLETQLVGFQSHVGDILRWVAALHPTPALGGSPKFSALAYLLAHEPMDRGWYAGPIGWFSSRGEGAFAVAIRSALVQPQQVYAYAGAGMVATSDAAAEWQETVLKLQTIQQGLRVRPNF